ncbi:flagellar basal body P-ring protein FlgI [Gracilimonas sediminicola]|uniref:Flagellar P-ring protein n=1 Tax=Gracilimonas sediminicola TaxID=2952158 RepID=A0A9X2RH07_9BACT|nr:flagellar basal body P-ring protein FlgI [Gracilimonas sediminicola]MCP9291868.1 flagellar basal body P-ring protein FlgI [Gracilimonas sediminicola]
MKKTILAQIIVALVVFGLSVPLQAQSKLADLVEIQNAERTELIGYGLVTGLDRTGDRSSSSRGSVFTVQSIANMLENFGITVDADRLRTRNVAAVMVTATITPYHAPGSEIDITVSSLGDASSLQGGVLLQTPLFDPDNDAVFAKAQGPLIVGGITAEIPGARLSQNQTLTATIPSGGTVERNEEFNLSTEEPLGLVLREPNYANARNMVEIINETFDEELASMHHPGLVKVNWPEAFRDRGTMNVFTSIILEQEIQVQSPAKVVINERTGTIVAGGEVVIDDVMISHGNIQVRTQVTPYVSQPPAFSGGETQVFDVPEAGINEQAAQTIVLEPETNVQQLAGSLNALGLSPRDIISIFQALDRAGVLRGKLIVM